MSRRFSIHETAEVEINETADFYDLEDPGLGSVFIDEVERGAESISQSPGSGSVRPRTCAEETPRQIPILSGLLRSA
ncbi:MAG: hypothetical protein F9K13_05195 [Candidatus Methylomirabilis oxygeniifera]|uniref:Uncharacterized protein n=1 Tax=Methylomirabilis oxygeniifera TaxID=671143 RepID=D5MKQ9_METO1|nr:MAG: hypothetical protein F9K13_05195 [Candidatus Methylomirabilis oxyfera]CBE67706.1 protein of unknown function [Candidatus Methylomirabilis oxyfera]